MKDKTEDNMTRR